MGNLFVFDPSSGQSDHIVVNSGPQRLRESGHRRARGLRVPIAIDYGSAAPAPAPRTTEEEGKASKCFTDNSDWIGDKTVGIVSGKVVEVYHQKRDADIFANTTRALLIDSEWKLSTSILKDHISKRVVNQMVDGPVPQSLVVEVVKPLLPERVASPTRSSETHIPERSRTSPFRKLTCIRNFQEKCLHRRWR